MAVEQTQHLDLLRGQGHHEGPAARGARSPSRCGDDPLLERAGRISPVLRMAGGHIEYRPDGNGSEPLTIATLEEYVRNEGDGWGYVVDTLTHGLEEWLASSTGRVERHAGLS